LFENSRENSAFIRKKGIERIKKGKIIKGNSQKNRRKILWQRKLIIHQTQIRKSTKILPIQIKYSTMKKLKIIKRMLFNPKIYAIKMQMKFMNKENSL
jgi:hypothetical protein